MSLFLPNFIYRRITDIDFETIENFGIKALFLDVDNTLSTHHGTVLVNGLKKWIKEMSEKGISLLILSNSKNKRVKPFAKKVGLPFVSCALKPLPFGYNKAIRMLKCNKNNCAIIGDQIFTDVLGANLYGVKSILVRPIKLENGSSFKIRRYFERKILKDKF